MSQYVANDNRVAKRDNPWVASFSGMVAGFVAGFFATLAFHQVMLAFLHGLGLTARTPFAFERTPPLGAPAVLSLAFWGGLWGVALAYAEPRFSRGVNYWVSALLFGAIGPTLVTWFVSAPLHGLPVGAGWHLPGMMTSVFVNGAWGLGAALLLRLWRWSSRR
jgi:hypothetical protein